MNKKIKYILFDIDGVIVDCEMFSVQYQEKFGASNDEMLPFYKGIFQDCLVGKADLKEELKPWLVKWKWNGAVEEFLQAWFKAEHQIDKRVVRKVQELRLMGIKCFTATKQEKYRTEYIEKEMKFGEIFDGSFSSANLGHKKPDLKFFEIILDELKAEPAEVLFFDDEQANVDGAESLGIKSFLYIDFEKFEQDIKKFIN
jgi:putative hydrolase of the HAD superfamily